MKKFISLLLLITIMTSFLSGCSSDGDVQSGPVKITIWHDKEEAVANVLTKAFATLLPDIQVVLEKKDGLTDALKLVGNDAKSAPDMYFFAHDKIGVYAEMGILEPITTFVSKDVIAGYVESTIEAATYKDEIYQLPIYYETLLFMYNKSLMGDKDVPKTTEALFEYMKNNTKDGYFGFVEQHSTAYYSVPWIHGFSGSLIDELGNPMLNAPETIEALTYHHKFLSYMPGESEYSTVNTLFLEGYAHSTINGPWLVPSVIEAGIDLGFAKMPIVDETGLPLGPYTGVQGVHVLKVSAEKKNEAITKVLNLLVDPQVSINMAHVSGAAPALKKSYEDESIQKNEMIMAMKETAEKGVAMPNRPEMDVMFIVTGNLLVSINMKGNDIVAAVEEFQSKAEKLIEAMK